MKTPITIRKNHKNKKSKIFEFFIFLLIGLILTSCANVEFKHPMPQNGKSLNKIPKSLQGKYSTVVMGGLQKITIGKDYIVDEKGKKTLSESLVLIQSNEKYVLNIKKETFGNGEAGWNSYVVEDAGCGFLRIGMLAVSDKSNQNEAALKKLELFKSTYSAQKDTINNRYLLDINDKQFWQLMTDTNYVINVVLDKIK